MTFSLRRIQKRGINGSNCFVFYLLGLQWGSWDYRYFFISSYVFTVFLWILSIYISFVGGFLIFFFFHLMLASVWNGFSTCFIWGVIFNDIHDFDEISHSGRIVFQEGSSVGWNAGFKGLLGILEFRKGGLSKVPFCMFFFSNFVVSLSSGRRELMSVPSLLWDLCFPNSTFQGFSRQHNKNSTFFFFSS